MEQTATGGWLECQWKSTVYQAIKDEGGRHWLDWEEREPRKREKGRRREEESRKNEVSPNTTINQNGRGDEECGMYIDVGNDGWTIRAVAVQG